MKIETLEKKTKAELIELLQFKGINFSNKATKKELVARIANNGKKFAMGNRTGNMVYGTRVNTHAARVCAAIARQEVTSKKDIRKKVESRYSFNETLSRLEHEGIIRFRDKSKNEFELTQKGKELASMYGSNNLI